MKYQTQDFPEPGIFLSIIILFTSGFDISHLDFLFLLNLEDGGELVVRVMIQPFDVLRQGGLNSSAVILIERHAYAACGTQRSGNRHHMGGRILLHLMAMEFLRTIMGKECGDIHRIS